MSTHLLKAIEKLKSDLLTLASLAEEQLEKSIEALDALDKNLAATVIEEDVLVDQLEVDLEEECLRTLALYQPVAFDLRFVITVLKVNNDLERIADLASNAAQRTIEVERWKPPVIPVSFNEMGEKSRQMLRLSIDAFIKLDVSLAYAVCDADLEVDRIHSENFELIQKAILSYPDHSKALVQFLSVSRYFERIADLATNIAEDVIYLVEGKIVRHM